MANLKAPWEWCEFGQVFNGQLGHIYYWPLSDRVTESQSHRHPRVLSVLVGEIFLPDFNKLPYLLCSQGENRIIAEWFSKWWNVVHENNPKVLTNELCCLPSGIYYPEI